MNALDHTLLGLAKRHPEESPEFVEWIKHSSFVAFLKALPNLEEVCLYASYDHFFLYGIAVPAEIVTPPDAQDLDRWSCNPYSEWGMCTTSGADGKVFLSPPLNTESKTLDRGEQLVFARTFEGRRGDKTYFEISPRLVQSFGLHLVLERNAYCRLDENGDVQEVIRMVSIPADSGGRTIRAVIIQRSTLDEYMSITGQALVLLFDGNRYDPKSFSGVADNQPKYFQAEPEISYRMGLDPGHAGYIRGHQIIRSPLTEKDIRERFGFGARKKRQYTTFIAYDWQHGVLKECSCDPELLGNYFARSNHPHALSPVFFRPEVLQKYKADSEKYTLSHRTISCRGAWDLEAFDVNDAGQVHAYLKYLGSLPFAEQLYWKAFNEAPKGPVSRRSVMTDFEGKWDLEYEPLSSLQHFLQGLADGACRWWKPRSPELIDAVYYPVTAATDEWARELHALDKVLVEGLVTEVLRELIKGRGAAYDARWGSIKLLECLLTALEIEDGRVEEMVNPLQELHRLRSKVAGHAAGEEAAKMKVKVLQEHGSFAAHFRKLCAECDKSMRALNELLESARGA